MSRADLAATEHPTVKDIIWAAGVFEGEGNSTDWKAGVSIGQKDRWILDKFRALFGGAVGERHKLYKGEDYKYYCWHASGARARGFLMTVYQFLSPRRQEQVRSYLAH